MGLLIGAVGDTRRCRSHSGTGERGRDEGRNRRGRHNYEWSDGVRGWVGRTVEEVLREAIYSSMDRWVIDVRGVVKLRIEKHDARN